MAKKTNFKVGQLCKFKNSYALIIELYRKENKGEGCYLLFSGGHIGTVSVRSLKNV